MPSPSILLPIVLLPTTALVTALPDAHPEVTSAPPLPSPHDLLARQATSSIAVTCGFVDAYILSPLGCYQGSVCAQDLTAGVAGACCRLGDVEAGRCAPATRCVGLVDLKGQCGSGSECEEDDRVVKCSEFASRYCYTRYWPMDGQTPIQLGCTDTLDYTEYAYHSYTGYGDGGFTATAVDVSTVRAQSTAATSNADFAVPGASTAFEVTSSAGAASSAAAAGGDRAGSSGSSGGRGGTSPPAGAIAGGVIGGLAVLGLIAAIIVWLILRSRRKARDGQATFTSAPHGAGAHGGEIVKPNELPSAMYASGAVEMAHEGSYRPHEVFSDERGYAHEIHGRRVVGELP